MEDQKIIRLLKSKPSEGLQEAIRLYGNLLQIVIRRIIPNHPQDVEECVADTFVNAWKTIDRLDEDDNLKGYLLCIARNTAINRYHQLKRRNHTSLLDMQLVYDYDVELTVINEEALMELQREIMELAEPEQEIIIRKYFLFESLREIGSKVGLTEAQVKKRLYIIRQKLKTNLQKRGVTYEAI